MFLLIIALFFYFIYAFWEVVLPFSRVKSTFRWSQNPSGSGEPSIETPRYILITGCDSGFGYELALKLDSEGWNVLAACLTDEGLTRLAEKCSTQFLAVKCDITKPSDVQNLKSFYLGAMEKRGHPKVLYGLVNNAGIVAGSLFEWNSLEDYKKVMDVNFYGHLAITKAFLPLLIEQGRLQNYRRGSARIVNIISIAGVVAAAGMSPYNASKFAFESFTSCLRSEVHHYGIDVMFVNPGFMLTEIVKNANSSILQSWKLTDEETKQRWGESAIQRLDYFSKFTPRISESPLKCIHSILHALQAKSPKRRYLPGWQAKLMFLLPYLPAFVLELLQNVAGRFRPQQVTNHLKKASSLAQTAASLGNVPEQKGN